MKNQVLFIHGAGEGAYEEDRELGGKPAGSIRDRAQRAVSVDTKHG